MKKSLIIVTFLFLVSILFSLPCAFSDTNLPPNTTYNSGSNTPAHFTGAATPATTLTVNDGANISATVGNVSIDTVGWGNGTVNFGGNSNVTGSVGSGGLDIGTVNINGASGKIVNLQYTADPSTLINNLNFGGNGTVILNGGSYINSIGSITSGYGTVQVSATGNLNIYAGVGSALLPIAAIAVTADTVHFNGAINVYANNLIITNNGSFVFDSGSIYTGNGITTTDGTGRLELGGTSTITGTVGASGANISTISAGANGATDIFNNNVYANNINFTGTGLIELASGVNYNTGSGTGITTSNTGQGTLTFLGASSTGGNIGQSGTPIAAVNVNGGIVTLNNNIYATTTTVNSGGTLKLGSDETIGGALTVAGTGAVNISDHTLTNNGTYTQGAATTLNVATNSASDFGKINTTGNAAVTAGSTVNVAVGGYIPNNSTFEVINGAAGSVYGAPGTINSTSSLITFSSLISNGKFYLIANRSSTGYASLAANSNASAAGSTLDNISNPSTSMQSVLNTIDSLPASQISSGLNTLTPVVDNSSPQVSYQTQDQFIQTLNTHLEDINNPAYTGISTGDEDPDGLSLKGLDIWTQGLGSYLHEDPRGLSNGYNASIWGVTLGLDYPVTDELRLGVSSGFAQDFVNSKDNSATNDINNYNGTLYGAYTKDRYYINMAASFAYDTYDTSRQIAIGSLGYTATAKFNGQEYLGYVESGYSFQMQKFNLTPVVSFEYAHLHTADYTENGAGVLNLKTDSQDYDVAQTGLGFKLNYPLATKYGTFIPEARIKWLYDWVGDNQQATSTFTGGGGSFNTTGFTPAQSSYAFGIKLTLITKYNFTVSANYDFELKEDFYAHYGYLNAKYSF